MSIHSIRSVNDANSIIQLYELDPWCDDVGTAQGFANWLYIRQASVTTEELGPLVRRYQEEVCSAESEGRDLDFACETDADDAMSGYLVWQRTASNLMWLIREAKASVLGRTAWTAIAEMATTHDLHAELEGLHPVVLSEVHKLMRDLASMSSILNFDGGGRYSSPPGWPSCEFIRIAIERLDDTLEMVRHWENNELMWPIEVEAVMLLVKRGLRTVDVEVLRRPIDTVVN